MIDRVKISDWAIALVTGLAACAALWAFSVPGLDPDLWESAAIVQGILPPKTFFSGAWRHVPGMLSPALGAVGGGVLAFLVCLTVRTTFAILARPSAGMAVWRRFHAPALSVAAAWLAVTADPMWRACQVLTPTLALALAFATLFLLFVSWLWYARDWMLYATMVLAGALAAQCALTFLLLAFFAVCLHQVWRDVMNGAYKPVRPLPGLMDLPKWRMFLGFVLGFAACAALNIHTFVAADGLEVTDWGRSELLLHYAIDMLRSLLFAASPFGWGLAAIIGFAPVFATMKVLAGRVSDEEPLPFAYGLAALAFALVAAFQIMPIPAAWFWQWSPQQIAVRDPALLALICLGSAISVVWGFSAFVIENHGRANQYEGFTHVFLRIWAPLAVAGVLVFSLTGMWRPGVTAMQRLVDDAIAETVNEAEGLEWLFTDGSCDAAIEREAARRGTTLRTLNMMSTASARDTYLRLRGVTDEADTIAAKQGAPVMLRVWAGEKPGAMARVGIQLGFEYWKRANRKPPESSGLVARETWPDASACARGRAAGGALAKRILEIAKRTDTAAASPALRKAFSDISWRLARMARNRNEEGLATQLDTVNSALRHMLQALEYERIRTFMQLTPSEGLQLALKRADFVEARRFASAVLKANENDADANFGLGMSYLLENRLKEAEFYLARCLKLKPHEPAVQNNLAIIYRKTNRHREAVELARQAKKALPDNKEVATTLRECEEALAKSLGKNAAPKTPVQTARP